MFEKTYPEELDEAATTTHGNSNSVPQQIPISNVYQGPRQVIGETVYGGNKMNYFSSGIKPYSNDLKSTVPSYDTHDMLRDNKHDIFQCLCDSNTHPTLSTRPGLSTQQHHDAINNTRLLGIQLDKSDTTSREYLLQLAVAMRAYLEAFCQNSSLLEFTEHLSLCCCAAFKAPLVLAFVHDADSDDLVTYFPTGKVSWKDVLDGFFNTDPLPKDGGFSLEVIRVSGRYGFLGSLFRKIIDAEWHTFKPNDIEVKGHLLPMTSYGQGSWNDNDRVTRNLRPHSLTKNPTESNLRHFVHHDRNRLSFPTMKTVSSYSNHQDMSNSSINKHHLLEKTSWNPSEHNLSEQSTLLDRFYNQAVYSTPTFHSILASSRNTVPSLLSTRHISEQPMDDNTINKPQSKLQSIDQQTSHKHVMIPSFHELTSFDAADMSDISNSTPRDMDQEFEFETCPQTHTQHRSCPMRQQAFSAQTRTLTNSTPQLRFSVQPMLTRRRLSSEEQDYPIMKHSFEGSSAGISSPNCHGPSHQDIDHLQETNRLHALKAGTIADTVLVQFLKRKIPQLLTQEKCDVLPSVPSEAQYSYHTFKNGKGGPNECLNKESVIPKRTKHKNEDKGLLNHLHHAQHRLSIGLNPQSLTGLVVSPTMSHHHFDTSLSTYTTHPSHTNSSLTSCRSSLTGDCRPNSSIQTPQLQTQSLPLQSLGLVDSRGRCRRLSTVFNVLYGGFAPTLSPRSPQPQRRYEVSLGKDENTANCRISLAFFHTPPPPGVSSGNHMPVPSVLQLPSLSPHSSRNSSVYYAGTSGYDGPSHLTDTDYSIEGINSHRHNEPGVSQHKIRYSCSEIELRQAKRSVNSRKLPSYLNQEKLTGSFNQISNSNNLHTVHELSHHQSLQHNQLSYLSDIRHTLFPRRWSDGALVLPTEQFNFNAYDANSDVFVNTDFHSSGTEFQDWHTCSDKSVSPRQVFNRKQLNGSIDDGQGIFGAYKFSGSPANSRRGTCQVFNRQHSLPAINVISATNSLALSYLDLYDKSNNEKTDEFQKLNDPNTISSVSQHDKQQFDIGHPKYTMESMNTNKETKLFDQENHIRLYDDPSLKTVFPTQQTNDIQHRLHKDITHLYKKKNQDVFLSMSKIKNPSISLPTSPSAKESKEQGQLPSTLPVLCRTLFNVQGLTGKTPIGMICIFSPTEDIPEPEHHRKLLGHVANQTQGLLRQVIQLDKMRREQEKRNIILRFYRDVCKDMNDRDATVIRLLHLVKEVMNAGEVALFVADYAAKDFICCAGNSRCEGMRLSWNDPLLGPCFWSKRIYTAASPSTTTTPKVLPASAPPLHPRLSLDTLSQKQDTFHEVSPVILGEFPTRSVTEPNELYPFQPKDNQNLNHIRSNLTRDDISRFVENGSHRRFLDKKEDTNYGINSSDKKIHLISDKFRHTVDFRDESFTTQKRKFADISFLEASESINIHYDIVAKDFISRSCMCIPLMNAEGVVIAVLQVLNRFPSNFKLSQFSDHGQAQGSTDTLASPSSRRRASGTPWIPTDFKGRTSLPLAPTHSQPSPLSSPILNGESSNALPSCSWPMTFAKSYMNVIEDQQLQQDKIVFQEGQMESGASFSSLTSRSTVSPRHPTLDGVKRKTLISGPAATAAGLLSWHSTGNSLLEPMLLQTGVFLDTEAMGCTPLRDRMANLDSVVMFSREDESLLQTLADELTLVYSGPLSRFCMRVILSSQQPGSSGKLPTLPENPISSSVNPLVRDHVWVSTPTDNSPPDSRHDISRRRRRRSAAPGNKSLLIHRSFTTTSPIGSDKHRTRSGARNVPADSIAGIQTVRRHQSMVATKLHSTRNSHDTAGSTRLGVKRLCIRKKRDITSLRAGLNKRTFLQEESVGNSVLFSGEKQSLLQSESVCKLFPSKRLQKVEHNKKQNLKFQNRISTKSDSYNNLKMESQNKCSIPNFGFSTQSDLNLMKRSWSSLSQTWSSSNRSISMNRADSNRLSDWTDDMVDKLNSSSSKMFSRNDDSQLPLNHCHSLQNIHYSKDTVLDNRKYSTGRKIAQGFKSSQSVSSDELFKTDQTGIGDSHQHFKLGQQLSASLIVQDNIFATNDAQETRKNDVSSLIVVESEETGSNQHPVCKTSFHIDINQRKNEETTGESDEGQRVMFENHLRDNLNKTVNHQTKIGFPDQGVHAIMKKQLLHSIKHDRKKLRLGSGKSYLQTSRGDPFLRRISLHRSLSFNQPGKQATIKGFYRDKLFLRRRCISARKNRLSTTSTLPSVIPSGVSLSLSPSLELSTVYSEKKRKHLNKIHRAYRNVEIIQPTSKDFLQDTGECVVKKRKSWRFFTNKRRKKKLYILSRRHHIPPLNEVILNWGIYWWNYSLEEIQHFFLQSITGFGLIDTLNIQFPDRFISFLKAISGSYHSRNPYHNFFHGIQVYHVTWLLLSHYGLSQYLRHVETFGTLIGALCHDVDHPGLNNDFFVTIQHPTALLYNDVSVLENHHCAFSFRILESYPEYDFRQGMSDTDKRTFRRTFIRGVLATDMQLHSQKLANFSNRVQRHDLGTEPLCISNIDDRNTIIEMVIHAADISNPMTPPPCFKRWASLIVEEFNLQCDREAAVGLDVTAFMNCRTQKPRVDCQIGFVEFIVLPMWRSMALLVPELKAVVEQGEDNARYWHDSAERLISCTGEEIEAFSNDFSFKLASFRRRHPPVVLKPSELRKPMPDTKFWFS